MKRVLQVISSLEQGGVETVVLNYFSNMEDDKIAYDFLVIWGENKGYFEDYLISKGCRIFKMENPPSSFFAHGKELKRFFKREKYGTVHIHAMSALRYRVAKAAKKAGVKNVIYHSHSSSNERHLLYHKLLKGRLDKWCDYKFACSNLAGKYMYKGKFELVHNAIDTHRFAFNSGLREQLRKDYGLEDKIVIGNVGRLSKLKNQQFLLKVLNILNKNNKNVVLFCIGEGNESQALLDYAAANDLKIILAGTVGKEVYKYYSMFDILAFPSHYEGLSMVLIEAQSNGLPIVASDRLSEEHKLTENFEFLPIDETDENYGAWANAILKSANKRIDNSAAVAAAGYDIKTEAKKLQEFYLSLSV